MGLDWCVRNKRGDGKHPAEELGAIRLSRDNPESLRAFKEVYDSYQEHAAQQRSEFEQQVIYTVNELLEAARRAQEAGVNVPMDAIDDIPEVQMAAVIGAYGDLDTWLPGTGSLEPEVLRRFARAFADAHLAHTKNRPALFFGLPFEFVVNHEAGKHPVLMDTIKKPGPGGNASFMCSRLDFRGKIIGYMPGLPQRVRERAYKDFDPREAVKYGEELRKHERFVSDEDRPYLIQAAEFLAFWGSRGYSIFAWS